MSQSICQYQASFVVCGEALSSEEKLHVAQETIFQWIKKKETDRYCRSGSDRSTSFILKNAFYRRFDAESSCSWCKTEYCKTDDTFAWAVRHEHRGEITSDVKDWHSFWITEIGLRAFLKTGDLVVNVKLSYKWLKEFSLESEQEHRPDSTIPHCIKVMRKRFLDKGCLFYSQGYDVSSMFGSVVKVEDEESAAKVCSFINSRDRQAAVVLMVGGGEDVAEMANKLAHRILAKGSVFLVPYNHQILSVFRQNFPKLKPEFNNAYFIMESRRGLEFKRLSLLESLDDNPWKNILNVWLGSQPIYENGAVGNLDEVRNLIRRTKFTQLLADLKNRVPKEEYEHVKQKLTESEELFDLSQEENKDHVEEKKVLEEENECLKDRVDELKDQVEQVDRKHAEELYNMAVKHDIEKEQLKSEIPVLPREYPNSFENLRAFAPFYKNLIFTDNAWKVALEYRNFRNFEVAWEMLFDLDQKLWPLVFEKSGIDIAFEFNSQSQYTCAKTEGKATKADASLVKERMFTFNGKQYEMWAHLKYGNQSGKQLRIYFAYDHASRKIVVNYIGDHLNNASTKNLS